MRYFAILYLLPAVEVLLPLAIGLALLKVNAKQRSFTRWSIGMSITLAGTVTLVVMVIFFRKMATASGMERIPLLIGPVIPLELIPVIAVITYSSLGLWAYFRPSRFEKRGLVRMPGLLHARVTGSILTISVAITLFVLLPYIQMFPYLSLSFESNSRIYKCWAWNPYVKKSVHIFTLRNTAWPDIKPRFEHKTDWRGRVILHVTDGRDKSHLPVKRTYYLPFEAGTYELKDGVLQKISTEVHTDWEYDLLNDG